MTIKLPEPDYKVMFNGEWRNLYYEESLKQAIKDALEEAAQICESEYDNWDNERSLRFCVTQIRKLKDQL